MTITRVASRRSMYSAMALLSLVVLSLLVLTWDENLMMGLQRDLFLYQNTASMPLSKHLSEVVQTPLLLEEQHAQLQ